MGRWDGERAVGILFRQIEAAEKTVLKTVTLLES